MDARIGIVGGGQLGRMLAIAAKYLGFSVIILDPTLGSPAGQVADREIIGDFNDKEKIMQLASECDYLTFEIELADADILGQISHHVKVNPSPKTLKMIQDKYFQKTFLRGAGIPTAEFENLESPKDVLQTAKRLGYPFLLKIKCDAYDGRGNALIKNDGDIELALARLAGRPLYIERYIEFEKELAVIAARGMDGAIVIYPVVETIQRNNICHSVCAPAPISRATEQKVFGMIQITMEHLEGAGVFGIEMFLMSNGEVLINEIAPRVHNSGHFSIEACFTSQFEQHIRAITGLPLGSAKMKVPAAVMVNILGSRKGVANISGLEKALAIDGVSVHIYGKKEVRPERKMGHITVIDKDIAGAFQKATRARELIEI